MKQSEKKNERGSLHANVKHCLRLKSSVLLYLIKQRFTNKSASDIIFIYHLTGNRWKNLGSKQLNWQGKHSKEGWTMECRGE